MLLLKDQLPALLLPGPAASVFLHAALLQSRYSSTFFLSFTPMRIRRGEENAATTLWLSALKSRTPVGVE